MLCLTDQAIERHLRDAMLGYRIVELPSRIVSGWCEQHNQFLVQPMPVLLHTDFSTE